MYIITQYYVVYFHHVPEWDKTPPFEIETLLEVALVDVIIQPPPSPSSDLGLQLAIV